MHKSEFLLNSISSRAANAKTFVPIWGCCSTRSPARRWGRSGHETQWRRRYRAIFTHTCTPVGSSTVTLKRKKQCESTGERKGKKKNGKTCWTCNNTNRVLVVSSDLCQFNRSFRRNRRRYFVHTPSDRSLANLSVSVEEKKRYLTACMWPAAHRALFRKPGGGFGC